MEATLNLAVDRGGFESVQLDGYAVLLDRSLHRECRWLGDGSLTLNATEVGRWALARAAFWPAARLVVGAAFSFSSYASVRSFVFALVVF